MDELHDRIETFGQHLPERHEPYTDKYFQHTKDILEADGTNPQASIKVFARGDGPVPQDGLAEAAAILDTYTDEDFGEHGSVWVTEKDEFETKDPLIVLEGPITEIVELETMYLGALSHRLTAAHPDHDLPEPDAFQKDVGAAADIYAEEDIPLLYFGARHYHFDYDHALAGAALDAGAVQTSTDIGSANIGKNGVGTTPHVLTLALASKYGRDDATRKTAELYDTHIDDDGPGTTLVDTFNQEIDDALAVCEWFDSEYGEDNWEHKFRVDTCGENIAQGGEAHDPEAGSYETGTGVRIAGVKALRDTLIEEGYGDQTEIILSSGFGNPEKARAFVDAQAQYREETAEQFGESYDLFSGVGAGAFADGIHCTADMYAADGEAMYKTGRPVDIDEIEAYKQDNMQKVIG